MSPALAARLAASVGGVSSSTTSVISAGLGKERPLTKTVCFSSRSAPVAAPALMPSAASFAAAALSSLRCSASHLVTAARELPFQSASAVTAAVTAAMASSAEPGGIPHAVWAPLCVCSWSSWACRDRDARPSAGG